jgi:hypothetical protein
VHQRPTLELRDPRAQLPLAADTRQPGGAELDREQLRAALADLQRVRHLGRKHDHDAGGALADALADPLANDAAAHQADHAVRVSVGGHAAAAGVGDLAEHEARHVAASQHGPVELSGLKSGRHPRIAPGRAARARGMAGA